MYKQGELDIDSDIHKITRRFASLDIAGQNNGGRPGYSRRHTATTLASDRDGRNNITCNDMINKIMKQLSHIKKLDLVTNELDLDEWFIELEDSAKLIGIEQSNITALLPRFMSTDLTYDLYQLQKGLTYEQTRDALTTTWWPPTEIPYDKLVTKLRNPTIKARNVGEAIRGIHKLNDRITRVNARNPDNQQISEAIYKKAFGRRLPPMLAKEVNGLIHNRETTLTQLVSQSRILEASFEEEMVQIQRKLQQLRNKPQREKPAPQDHQPDNRRPHYEAHKRTRLDQMFAFDNNSDTEEHTLPIYDEDNEAITKDLHSTLRLEKLQVETHTREVTVWLDDTRGIGRVDSGADATIIGLRTLRKFSGDDITSKI